MVNRLTRLKQRIRTVPASLSRPFSLGVSLVVLSLSVLLFLDIFGLRDNGRLQVGESRKLVAQTLAMHLSTLIETGDDAGAEYAASIIVLHNEDVRAVSLTRSDGTDLGRYGDLDRLDGGGAGSTLDRMNVPIFAQGLPWGTVRVAFAPDAGVRRDLLWLCAVGLGLFLSFLPFLRRVLVQLDPGRAVPGRVDSALSLFNSGIVVLDDRSRIIVANPAAVAIAGQPADTLIGRTLDAWPWNMPERWQPPWITALHGGPAASDELIELRDRDGSIRLLSVNCAFVGDDAQGLRGILVTMDDLTSVERKNRELAETLRQLNLSQAAIEEKNRELELLASTDPMTGLSNRRTLMERLARDMARCGEEAIPLACIMTDIDHFKSVNDTYGHAVGDEVIRAVAQVMRSAMRDGDTVGRYGGEEFVMVLPGLDAHGAASIAERVRVEVVALALGGRLAVPRLSSSFGVADSSCGAQDGAQLVDTADQALYRAKQGGRNRVELFQGPVDTSAAGAPAAPAVQSGQPSNEEMLQGRVFELESLLVSQQDEIDKLREFDTLTGVPMRTLFLQRLDTELERAARLRTFVGVVSVSIRDLDRIVATLGHAKGDALVVAVVERLQEALRITDHVSAINGAHSVSRVTAHEYGLLVNDLADVSGAMIVIARLKRLLSRPVLLEEERIYVGANIGIALSERAGTQGVVLLDQACEARVQAAVKPEKIAHAFSQTALDERSHDYIRLEADLHDALDSGSLETWFQPKFDLGRRRVTGMETLLRWQHPTRGFVPPDRFVLVAEANGMIERLSALVLTRTLAQIETWNAMGIDDLCVSINVSPSQLRSDSFVTEILSALDRSSVAGHQLEIELTETSVVDRPDEATTALELLRSRGIRISLDDFGTGASSLSLLSRLPLDTVKIDRSFVVAMADGERGEAMVESIITMGRALKLRVIAEGVETNEELEKLARFGCHEVQGYLISPPLASEDITHYLVRQRSASLQQRAWSTGKAA